MTPDQVPPPRNQGITQEAAEALGMEVPDDISSETADLSELGYLQFEGSLQAGDIVDAEIVEEPLYVTPEITVPKPAEREKAAGGRIRREETTGPRDAKTGPPSLDEWQKFFSRVLLKIITETYINWVFRGVEEDALSERDIERLLMTDDERKYISVPLAEISNKSRFMRRHGRMIVASGDAFNAFVVMAAWANRVNRIAAKYKPQSARVSETRLRSERNGTTPETGNPQGSYLNGSNGGRFPDGFSGTIVNPGSS